jgi:GTP cyclohydrolase I
MLRDRLGAKRAGIEVEFDYFVLKAAPVSKVAGLMDYRCAFIGEDSEGAQDLRLRVVVPVTLLCPCSKAISEAGAHNQRALVTVETRAEGFVWIEEIISWVESSASCPVFPVLKRVDEKYVTELAYANPRFVEDMVREVMVLLRGDGRVRWARVEAHSFESIHNHNAFAEAMWEA